MSTTKKIFLGSLITFLTVFLFWGVYIISFKKSSLDSQNNSSTNTSSPKKDSQEKLTVLTEEAVISPVILSDGVTIQYYGEDNGNVFQIDLAGNNKKTISTTTLPGLEKIIWSPSKKKVLSRSTREGKAIFAYYDFEKNRGGQLATDIKNVNFQNENKIIYTFQAPSGKASLNVADFDGKNWKKLIDLDFFGQKIEPVPQTGLISFVNYPNANYESKLYTTPLIGGEQKLLLSGKFGVDLVWNSNGSNILLSSVDKPGGNQITLGLFNFKKNEYKDLKIPTFVQKCAWSKDNKTIFYALPGSIPKNTILPNDYLNDTLNTVDTFWKVDLESGEKERLIELEEIITKIDATDLFLNNDESILFFINRYDNKLYSLDL